MPTPTPPHHMEPQQLMPQYAEPDYTTVAPQDTDEDVRMRWDRFYAETD